MHPGAVEKVVQHVHLLLRTCCGQYCQLSALCRVPSSTWPDKCEGWDPRPSKVMPYTGFMSAPVTVKTLPKGATYCKPDHYGVNQLKFGESWMPLWAFESPEFLYGSTYQCLRLSSLIHSIELSEEILTPRGSPIQSKSTEKCVGCHLPAAEAWLWKGPQVPHTIGVLFTQHSQLHRYC